jgi:peptidoglycan/xylan/chitin deacetylase (PgdA/CDA1 family)
MRPAPTAPAPQVLRRRRLVAVAAGGVVAVLTAAAIDVVRDRTAPAATASAPVSEAGIDESQATTERPWVWDQPPTAATPLPIAPAVAPVITRVDTTDPVVFLTVDDGVTRDRAGREAFTALGIPASLFLVDQPIQDAAAWFGELPGAVVESHSRTHPDMRTLGEAAQRDEICGNADLIESTYGRRPVLFRPPYGNYDGATQRAAAACGMRAIVLWQVNVNGQVVGFREVPRFRPGDIILMHFRPSFVQELHVIRDRVEQAGLHFALLEDYLAPDTVLPR